MHGTVGTCNEKMVTAIKYSVSEVAFISPHGHESPTKYYVLQPTSTFFRD